MRNKIHFLLLALLWTFAANGQDIRHEYGTNYCKPTERSVLAKLTKWQDQKFGLLLHWGVYSVPGICESWPLTSEEWITPDPVRSYDEYKSWYWGLSKDFNPTQFDPSQWAQVASDAGMRYAIFTTKHHDGFCLWDSKQTDYTVMNSGFGGNEKADVARYVFDAFRQRGLMMGAYFSKPDWHSPYYWWPARSTGERTHNYSIAKYPERWDSYKKYVYNQVDELMSGYGPLDILWLDGGWCTPPYEDIDLGAIVQNARSKQNGLLVVDRGCGGPYENYQTPEQRIPDCQILTPWETCLTLTNDWGWVQNPTYKSANEVVARLSEVTSKGGSLLLGVGPNPQGTIDQDAADRLQTVGQWLKAYGEAIYYSVPTPVYRNAAGNVWFTANKDSIHRYAIVTAGDSATLPQTVVWQGNVPNKLSAIVDLATGEWCKWKRNDHGEVVVTLPKQKVKEVNAVALRFSVTDMPIYKDSLFTVEQRVQDLLSRMTLAEKVGQLQCAIGWPMYEKSENGRLSVSQAFKARMDTMPVGGLWATFRADPWSQKTLQTGLSASECVRVANMLQRYTMDYSRLGIPLLLSEEAAHGVMAPGATVFPTGLAQSCTWNPSLIRQMGKEVGNQLTRRGGHMAYAPVLDLARDPRWSRVEETYGEDALLAGTLGSAMVQGLHDGGARSTLKHFAAYGISQGGLNGGDVEVGEKALKNEYALPFRMAVEAGADQVMAAYNSINGIPCSANPWLFDVLRRDWGFRGTVVSDLHSIEGIANNHGFADNVGEAASKALHAGVDVDLEGNGYSHLVRQFQEGHVAEAELDTAVARVLRMKFQLGLFEHPYLKEKVKDEESAEARQLALQVAREGIVLLENDGILPLSADLKKIAVIGPNMDAPYNQLGDYTAPQPDGKVTTLLKGLQMAYPKAQIAYERACGIRDTSYDCVQEAVELALQSDVTILAVGGSSARDFRTTYAHTGAALVEGLDSTDMDCGEGFDRSTLSLLGRQEALMQALIDAKVPLVVVYIEGRPLDMNLAAKNADALLVAWYPGEAGGEALADVLTGACNPSGRLSVSIPRHVGQLPVYYSRVPSHDYIDGSSLPLYDFGYGLTYSRFVYSNIQTTNQNGHSRVTLNVTNKSGRDGAEVVEVYSIAPHTEQARLVAFAKVQVPAGQTRPCTLEFPTPKGTIWVSGEHEAENPE